MTNEEADLLIDEHIFTKEDLFSFALAYYEDRFWVTDVCGEVDWCKYNEFHTFDWWIEERRKRIKNGTWTGVGTVVPPPKQTK